MMEKLEKSALSRRHVWSNFKVYMAIQVTHGLLIVKGVFVA